MQRVIQLTAAVLFNGYLVGFQKGRIYTGNSKAICLKINLSADNHITCQIAFTVYKNRSRRIHYRIAENLKIIVSGQQRNPIKARLL